MSLGDKRRKFTGMVARLIIYAESLGYGVAIDYVKRCRDCPVGKARSFHKRSLAVDLHLYKKDAAGRWRYKRKTEDHKLLGEFWIRMGGTWGAAWNDGNHYSLGEGRAQTIEA